MNTLSLRAMAAALVGASAAPWLSPAFAHAVDGERRFFFDDIFPDTLGKPIFMWGQR
ncbi:MAG: hypothetical protein WAU78_06315 [Roseiarcus sp.]|jgi:hypothetical protein